MLLKEAAPAALAPVPLADLKAHLRLGLGFADAGAEDGLVELYWRNAVALVEARTGQALIARGFLLKASAWDRRGHLVLPIGPVAAVDAIRFVQPGSTVALAPEEWALEPGRVRQRLTAPGGAALPPVPYGATAEMEFTAGYGADWPDVPDDLRQAVTMLAAHYFENRYGDLDAERQLPPAVGAILASHRPVRF